MLNDISVGNQTINISDTGGVIYQLKDNERTKWLSLQTGLADIGMAAGVIFTPMMRGDFR